MEQTQVEHKFTSAGFGDVLIGSQVFRLLGVNEMTFHDPVEFSKLREVAEFMNQHPEALSLAENVIRRNKGNTNPLDHLTGYIKLQNNKFKLRSELDRLDKELSLYE